MGVAYGRDVWGNLGFYGAYVIIEYPDQINVQVQTRGTRVDIPILVKMHVPTEDPDYPQFKYSFHGETFCSGGVLKHVDFEGYARWISRFVQVRIVEHNLVVASYNTNKIDTGNKGVGDYTIGNYTISFTIPDNVLTDFPPIDGKYTFEIWIGFYAVSYVLHTTSLECVPEYRDTDKADVKLNVTGVITTAPPPEERKAPPCENYGDLDGDGYITENDVKLAWQIYDSNEYDPKADVDGDGMISIWDVVAIKQYLQGDINDFPVCKLPPEERPKEKRFPWVAVGVASALLGLLMVKLGRKRV